MILYFKGNESAIKYINIYIYILSYLHIYWNVHVYVHIYIRSVAQSCSTLQPHELHHARPPCPSPTPGVHSLTSIESVMPSSHLILCRPLLLPPIPPSIRVFSNESTLRMRRPKYWSFSFLPKNTQN